MDKNLKISSEDLIFIRSLPDFDLIMLLSEINDHGWENGGKLLIPTMREADANGTLRPKAELQPRRPGLKPKK